MIRRLCVDGYKSLIDFELKLNPGLNVLVGPNGSGKTNIISFFEFLADLQEKSVSEVISQSGGLGSVFTKYGSNKYESEMSCLIEGEVHVEKEISIKYCYSFTIGFYQITTSIRYKSQRIKATFLDSKSHDIESRHSEDLEIALGWDDDENKIKVEVISYDNKKIESNLNMFSSAKDEDEDLETRLKNILGKAIDEDISIINPLWIIFDKAHLISSDIRCGGVYNIVPSKARIPEDSANRPGIKSDGSGLYATLFSIKQSEKNITQESSLFRLSKNHFISTSGVTLEKILDYIRLANDSVRKINVTNNPFDNKLQVSVGIKGDPEDTILPLALMSDGTIKWIALITIILTSRKFYLIEEPENYLHPLMQIEIMRIIRSNLMEDHIVILSTHSETILNNSKPEEIVIVKFLAGKTVARRSENYEVITKEIRETGFGLGYYYMAGVFDE